MLEDDIDISGIELYKYLGLEKYASDSEITKAYKKLALKVHPDKNLDSHKAKEQFQLLGKVFKVLTDVSSKTKYDQKLKAKDESEKRMKELDIQTIRFRKIFAERDREYLLEKREKEREEKEKQKLIERLREEGRQKLKERDERRARKQEKILLEKSVKENSYEPQGYNIKVAWKASKKDPIHAYSADDLKVLFSKYGNVLEVVKSSKKDGLYLIQFRFKEQAIISIEEKGNSSNPLIVTLMFKVDIPESPAPKKCPNGNLNCFDPVLDESLSSTTEKTVKYVSKKDFDALYSCCLVSEMQSITLVEENEIVTDVYVIRPITLKPKNACVVNLNRDYESFMERTLRQKAEREKLNQELIEEEEDT